MVYFYYLLLMLIFCINMKFDKILVELGFDYFGLDSNQFKLKLNRNFQLTY